MKKLSLILNVVLIFAVIGIYILHFTGNSCPKEQKINADSTVMKSIPAEGIVFINIDTVYANYDMYADIVGSLQDKLKTSEAQLVSKQRAFEKNVKDFQNKVNKGLVTRSEAANIEQSLQQEQQSLLMLQNELQYKLSEEEQVATRKVLNSIIEYLEVLKEEQPFQYVLSKSFGGQVLYASDNYDITQRVIKGLNENYKNKSSE